MTNKPEDNQNSNKTVDVSHEVPEITNENPKREVSVSLPQPDSKSPIKPKGDEAEAISEEAVAETYREKKVRAPLRFLALPPLYEIAKLSLREYDDFAEKLRRDKTFQSLQTISSGKSDAVLITLACNLLFALVESGGLIKGSPEEEILKLKITVIEAEFGFVQPDLEAGHTAMRKLLSRNQKQAKYPLIRDMVLGERFTLTEDFTYQCSSVTE